MFEGAADRLLWYLSQGIGAGSHYSGCAGDLCWTPWFSEHLLQSGLLSADVPGFVPVDATDVAPHCQKCLVKMDPPFQHVFADLFDRLPSHLRNMVDDVAPKAGGKWRELGKRTAKRKTRQWAHNQNLALGHNELLVEFWPKMVFRPREMCHKPPRSRATTLSMCFLVLK